MSNLKITGKTELSGEIAVSGNKNSALPCLAASLLLEPDQTMELANIPDIRDVRVFIEMLRNLGLEINRTKPGVLLIKADSTRLGGPGDKEIRIPMEEARKLRASILLVGPLLRLYDRVLLPQPGGCKIGPRPIDTHLDAFKELGIKIKNTDDGFTCLERNRLEESDEVKELWLKETSVTATENILLFAAGSLNNHLIIKNAACEPHIQTLCYLLELMGAKISGQESNLLTVHAGKLGENPAWPLAAKIEPDYIEALTFAVAAAVAKSNVIVKNIYPKELELIKKYLDQMGVFSYFAERTNSYDWLIWGKKVFEFPPAISPALKEIKAEPWYGLPTDALPLFLVLATQRKGELEFIDYMYNGRLINLANALNNMGADIKILGNRGLLVKGPTPLRGRTQLSPDLRNGVGLVLAGLCAEGESIIQNFEIVERGYQKLPEKLSALGAKVETV
ncbi:MAG: UDP-N-acetylglucosamine 1-carboxyvinyltransferase [Candidatus Yanofskybacteria bacterium]|nr:UDP-N-acetylglucosamine 1-carboxyvinyltransferase [Candidatus Yanofskybacteria bacterium]